ncbi:MAG: glycosyltransferase family 2 protein [Betaproteobacteria bacterium]|nr:glycosyltransferase family 2 protein [Betaproteobacteria bacterium]
MLAECIASVAAQTRPPLEHLICVDYERAGVVATTNRLCGFARGDRILPIADDDLLLPECLEKLEGGGPPDAIVYSEMRVEGEWWPPVGPDPQTLPSTALIPTELWHRLGGYRVTQRPEDQDFWQRAREAGTRFCYVPDVTWVYRFWGGNISRR